MELKSQSQGGKSTIGPHPFMLHHLSLDGKDTVHHMTPLATPVSKPCKPQVLHYITLHYITMIPLQILFTSQV